MSVLEFIAAWKWPVVVLVALAVVSRGFKDPENGRWLRDFMQRRDINFRFGPAEAAATLSSVAGDAVQVAASTDAELAASSAAQEETRPAAGAEPGVGAQERGSEDVAGLRRDAVEAVMKASAQWGWDMAQIGFRSAPEPQIVWDNSGIPRVALGKPSRRGLMRQQWPDHPENAELDATLRRLRERNRREGGTVL